MSTPQDIQEVRPSDRPDEPALYILGIDPDDEAETLEERQAHTDKAIREYKAIAFGAASMIAFGTMSITPVSGWTYAHVIFGLWMAREAWPFSWHS